MSKSAESAIKLRELDELKFIILNLYLLTFSQMG